MQGSLNYQDKPHSRMSAQTVCIKLRCLTECGLFPTRTSWKCYSFLQYPIASTTFSGVIQTYPSGQVYPLIVPQPQISSQT